MNNSASQIDKMKKKRSLVVIDGALSLIALLLIVQMWLLTATLESHLAGHKETALPAAVLSGILLACCWALYVFIGRAERQARSATPTQGGPNSLPQ